MDGVEPGGMPSRRGLVIGLMLCVVAIAFEAIAVVTAMPAAAADLGDLDLYAWAFTAFMIAQTFAIVAAGQASDKFGPKLPLVIGFVVFALGLVLAGLAPTMQVLVAGRFVQGLGGGTMNLAVMVLIGRLFDPKERAVMMTWLSIAWMAPALFGPLVAAWLSTTWSWHWVFFSVLPLMAIGGALILPPLARTELGPTEPVPAGPGARTETRGSRMLIAAALVAAGTVALQVAGQRFELWSLLWLVAGLGVLGYALPVLLPPGYRPAGPGLAATVNVRLLATGAFFGAETFLPLTLINAEHFDLAGAGLVLTVGSAGWTFGAWLQSRRWLRLRRDQIVVAGVAGEAVGLVMIAIAAWLPGQLSWLMIAGWAVGGLGMGLHMASTSLVVMELSAEAELGRNTSSLQVSEALGNSVAAGIAGTIFAAFLTSQSLAFGWLFVAMAMLTMLGLASSLRIGPVVNHSLDNISTSR
ncbi:MFS transporter [Propionicimonas sp.]|uniref:MFS transporter n=2 Tax=Propionicimonas sp. TaxID=1955623 RepID=UPI001825224B|nr:MFS transporter [Propionicimonas sp.]MBU3977122.1 MFS transporter [Actinomycetota bacterium]MBA3020691.1 MFS transporter [Propionicimonas sp.]MBU3985062.1 MFS transporter [Actinomycetota bacterium]MBU4006981.1 MFS transporter [Actinomycetota bacterium]MBU4064734.1 MFS transporter [Actinomycetota bacterium]